MHEQTWQSTIRPEVLLFATAGHFNTKRSNKHTSFTLPHIVGYSNTVAVFICSICRLALSTVVSFPHRIASTFQTAVRSLHESANRDRL